MSSSTHGGLWRVAWTIAWRGLHTYVRRPDLLVPSLVFPLVFFASFAGGLSALGSVPGFHFPAGYTAFQFVFVLCQSAMFGGLFTGFSLAFDFESGFARRLMLAAEDRRGIALGYALVALSRAAITLALITAVALATGMRITGDGIDIFGLYGLAFMLTLIGYGWAAGVAFRFRSIQAGPLMQTPVFLLLFLAPVYVPLALLKGLDPLRREHQSRDRVPGRRARLDLRRAGAHGARVRLRAGADRAVHDLDAQRAAQRRKLGLAGPQPPTAVCGPFVCAAKEWTYGDGP
jgi:ABC-2 type transport system permease protein